MEKFVMLNPSGYSVQVLSLLLASSMTTKELALALGEAGYGYDSVRVKVAKMARAGLIYKQGNRLSPWLIAERAIIAACNRWDRQIYPIQMCEDYLRTQLPSFNFIKAKINSMGM